MFLRGRPITMYVPSGLGPYGGLRAELPPERLQLDWVYPIWGGTPPWGGPRPRLGVPDPARGSLCLAGGPCP